MKKVSLKSNYPILDLLRYIDIECKRLDNLTTFLPIYEEYILEHLLIMIINYKNSFLLEFL